MALGVSSSASSYWQDYYSAAAAPEEPSDFARFACERLRGCQTVIDLGCGNGRDALHFMGAGYKVVAIDDSAAAVEAVRHRAAAAGHPDAQGQVWCCNAADPAVWQQLAQQTAGVVGIYARFFFHAIDDETAAALLDEIANFLIASGGILLAEFRTPADEPLQKAAPPHYRRYIDPAAFCAELEQRGLRVTEHCAGQGMAIYRGEDAHVARVIAVPAVGYRKGKPSPGLVRLQAAEKALAARFADYCRAERLTTFLVAGSALGAVRHGDIIPWDDDVDLGMLRPDYERLLKVWTERPLPGLTLQYHGTEPGYPLAYAKLRIDGTRVYERTFAGTGFHEGIGLDIFPFDRLPRSAVWRRIQQWGLMAINIFVMSYSPAVTGNSNRPVINATRRILLGLRPILPIAALVWLRERLSNPRWLARSTDRACFEMWGIRFAHRTRVPEDWLIPTRMAQFGDGEMPIPGQAERYLESAFGNYLALPPDDQRHPLHITAAEFGPLPTE